MPHKAFDPRTCLAPGSEGKAGVQVGALLSCFGLGMVVAPEKFIDKLVSDSFYEQHAAVSSILGALTGEDRLNLFNRIEGLHLSVCRCSSNPPICPQLAPAREDQLHLRRAPFKRPWHVYIKGNTCVCNTMCWLSHMYPSTRLSILVQEMACNWAMAGVTEVPW